MGGRHDVLMSANLLLSRTSFHTVTIQPGEKEQSMHTDDGLINLPRPRPLMGVVSLSSQSFLRAGARGLN